MSKPPMPDWVRVYMSVLTRKINESDNPRAYKIYARLCKEYGEARPAPQAAYVPSDDQWVDCESVIEGRHRQSAKQVTQNRALAIRLQLLRAAYINTDSTATVESVARLAGINRKHCRQKLRRMVQEDLLTHDLTTDTYSLTDHAKSLLKT